MEVIGYAFLDLVVTGLISYFFATMAVRRTMKRRLTTLGSADIANYRSSIALIQRLVLRDEMIAFLDATELNKAAKIIQIYEQGSRNEIPQ